MVTGQRLFNGRTPTEIALKQIQAEPAPPRSLNRAIPANLEKTILRALAKNPADRQQSASELSEELQTSTSQIFIPLAVTWPETPEAQEAVNPFDPVFSENGIAPADEAGEIDEEEETRLKLVRRRRRRLVAAAAAILIAVIAAAALFGRSSFSSRRGAGAAGATGAAASLLPAAAPVIGSDADALELAANASGQSNSAINRASANGQTTPDSNQQTQPADSAAANNKSVTRTAIPPTPSPAPSPIQPNALPQMPPAPSPDIALNRAPEVESEPDPSQGPRKERDRDDWRRGDESPGSYPNRGPIGDRDHDLNRDGGNDDETDAKYW